MTSRDIYFEIQQIGQSMKVTAIDPLTLTEATIVGPASYSTEMLKRQALRKLEYLLRR